MRACASGGGNWRARKPEQKARARATSVWTGPPSQQFACRQQRAAVVGRRRPPQSCLPSACSKDSQRSAAVSTSCDRRRAVDSSQVFRDVRHRAKVVWLFYLFVYDPVNTRMKWNVWNKYKTCAIKLNFKWVTQIIWWKIWRISYVIISKTSSHLTASEVTLLSSTSPPGNDLVGQFFQYSLSIVIRRLRSQTVQYASTFRREHTMSSDRVFERRTVSKRRTSANLEDVPEKQFQNAQNTQNGWAGVVAAASAAAAAAASTRAKIAAKNQQRTTFQPHPDASCDWFFKVSGNRVSEHVILIIFWITVVC